MREGGSATSAVLARSDTAIAPRRLLFGLLFGLLIAVSTPAAAQLAPDLHYKTISTAHFRVTFADSLENVARRAAGSAERAYAALSRELQSPRGTIDIVVADNLDISNGYATPTPSNRIVIYARPSIDIGSLRFVDDWVDMVVTHELTHIFHLDRTRGIWKLGQWIFGRNPFLFPNTYGPSWLTEGIAVHYESKLTGAGRELGTDFDALVRANENAGQTPSAHELSSATPFYPLGNFAYAYGNELVERVAAKGGPDGMRKFIDGTAGSIIPYLLNTNSASAFGISFDSAYAEWADSVHREAQRVLRRTRPMPPLVANAWFATRLRWLDNETLIFGGSDTKSVPSLRQVNTKDSVVRVIGTRNSNDATAPLAGGWRFFAQQEYLDPYTQRSDLWVEHDGDAKRLTTGARLMQPDAHLCDAATRLIPTEVVYVPSAAALSGPTFCIVAVQIVPGGTRIAQAIWSPAGIRVAALTAATPSEVWSEPRLSRSGTRIAATRRNLNGTSEIVVLDLNGRVIRTIGTTRAVNATPAWGSGDSTIYFTSDRSGHAALYRYVIAGAAAGSLTRIADSPTAILEGEPSPDGKKLALLSLGANGAELSVIDLPARGAVADSVGVLPPARGTTQPTSDAPASSYSAWRTVLPRYWMPTLDQGFRNYYKYGFTTGGNDIVDRHSWSLAGAVEPKNNEPEFDANYSFAGLGNPVISLGASQVWDHPGIPDSARKVLLPIERRKYFADLSATFQRRRYRNSTVLTVGTSYEWRDFRTLSEAPASRFSPADRVALAKSYTYPSFFAGVGFSNARVPYLALGPEDGFTANASVRQRWRSDAASTTRATTIIGNITGYRGFDFGGRMHHLLAIRAAAGTTDITSASELTVGGNSGSIFNLGPGINIGDGRRTFFVRGFEGGTLGGSRAMSGNIEWRAPISLPASGLWALPVYFQRLSAVLFSDAATAWCDAGANTSPICPKATTQEWISNVGAELHLDTALQYDSPYRFRLGYAYPTVGWKHAPSKNGNVYFTVGLPF